MIDLSKLSIEDLFTYYTVESGDSDLFELVPLLTLALGDIGKVYKVLEKIRKGAKLEAYYPAEDETPPKGEEIGPIYDGLLYLTNG